MTTHKNLMALCLAALFTLGLAACGSDGSDPVTTMPDPMPPEPDPDADMEREAIGDPMQTEWTIDGTAADAAGQWSGNFKNVGDDGVPQVTTGTFHSVYGTAGRMVGAFGATKQ